MSSNTSLEVPEGSDDVAASEQFLYMATGDGLCCLTHDGTEVASYEDQDFCISGPVLGPDGLLFCVLYDRDDYTEDEIIALDAQTLQPRYQFGLSLLNDARGMAVVGEELFVCDKDNDRLQVFSLAGEHRRSITGEWKQPTGLCLVEDRLYLVEEADNEVEEEGEQLAIIFSGQQGRRIVVLSLQGEILQVYTNPVEGQFFTETLCCFDGKLLAPSRIRRRATIYVVPFSEMVALRGV
jgi:hypothetical protein